jgi:hypothetical protein
MKNGTITLNAPFNPTGNLATPHSRTDDNAACKCDLMMALQRALHHDRAQLAALTGNDSDIKTTNPLLRTHIRN